MGARQASGPGDAEPRPRGGLGEADGDRETRDALTLPCLWDIKEERPGAAGSMDQVASKAQVGRVPRETSVRTTRSSDKVTLGD